MNRWKALEIAQRITRDRVPGHDRTQPRLNMGGTYIDDFPSGGGIRIPPESLEPGPPPAPVLPVPGIGRNLSQQEAEGAALASLLQPPSLAIGKGRGGAGGVDPGGQSLNAAGQVEVVRSAWAEMPAGGQPFTFMNAAAVALGAIGTITPVLTFTVPRRKSGIIEFVANQFVGGGWTEGTGQLIWRITRDGIPIQGYDNMIASMGTVANPGWLGTRPIRLYENQVIALVLLNVAIVPAAQPLLGLFRGGFWPLEQEGRNQSWL